MLADRPARCRLRHRGLGAARRGGRRGLDGGAVDQHGAGAGAPSRRSPPPPTCSTSCKAPTTTPLSTSTWRSARFTASPATTSCSTPFSCTRTTRSTPPRCRASMSWPSPRSPPANTTTTRLTVQALPGRELGLRVEFDTDVFDAASIEALIERFRAGVGGHDRRPGPAAVVDGCARCR